MTRAPALVAFALLISCAKNFAELAPFPCPGDHQCPAGLACVAGIGCTIPGLDAYCNAATDCAIADPAAVCGFGLCLIPCHDGAGCAAGRVCSAASGAGFCVIDCGAGACPTELTCTGLWYQGHRGCLPPGIGLGACASVTVADQCPTPPAQCDQSNFTVTCPSSELCAANSICIDLANGHFNCRCGEGYESVNCSGDLCSVIKTCAYPNWACRKVATPGCDDPLSPVTATCVCLDGRNLDVSCGVAQSCDSLCQQ